MLNNVISRGCEDYLDLLEITGRGKAESSNNNESEILFLGILNEKGNFTYSHADEK
jgi:hypothetical protein